MNSLTEMGFTKARSELALLETNNGGVEVAIEWLLQADQNKDREAQAMREWDLTPVPKPVQKGPETDTKMSAIPKRVVQLSDIIAVAAGTDHTAVACARGVYTFGCNAHGQLGHGNLSDSHVPLRVKALSHAQTRDTIVSVAAGQCHTLFVSDSNRVYASGSCDLGQFAPVGSVIGSSMFAASASSSGSLPSGKRSLHAVPVRIQLPFLDAHNASSKAVLHEAKAGGHASVFLIRAVDDPVCLLLLARHSSKCLPLWQHILAVFACHLASRCQSWTCALPLQLKSACFCVRTPLHAAHCLLVSLNMEMTGCVCSHAASSAACKQSVVCIAGRGASSVADGAP
jgi:hypothetical protein